MLKLRFLVPYAAILILTACGQTDIGKTNRNGNNYNRRQDPVENDSTTTVMSNMHRNRGATILTIAEEIEMILKRTLSSKYRTVPDIGIDDEGKQNKNVVFAERPNTDCGINLIFGGIQNRILDCQKNNSTKNVWDGGEKGASGEALWRLVYNYDAKNLEIWLDTRTGLVWTDIIAKNGNWCQASGNDQDITATDLPAGVDCSAIRDGENLCGDLSVSGIGSSIVWRLPTRNDYLQADLDGMRFIFTPKNKDLWTATLVADKPNRNFAWTWNDKNGALKESAMISSNLPVEQSIRCVGAPVR